MKPSESKRIPNLNTHSTFADRLTISGVKEVNFELNKDKEKVKSQRIECEATKELWSKEMQENLKEGNYEFFGEKRTFAESGV